MSTRRYAPLALAISLSLAGSSAYASATRNQKPNGQIEKSQESRGKSLWRAVQKGFKHGSISAGVAEFRDRRAVSNLARLRSEVRATEQEVKAAKSMEITTAKAAEVTTAPEAKVTIAEAPAKHPTMKSKYSLNSGERRQLQRIADGRKIDPKMTAAQAQAKLDAVKAEVVEAKVEAPKTSGGDPSLLAYKLSRRNNMRRTTLRTPGIEVR